MTIHTTRGLVCIAGVLLAACAAPAKDAAPPPPPAITQAAIDKVVQDQVSALVAGDAAKAAAVYAPDAVLVTARGKAEGAGIASFWTEALKTPGAGKDLKVNILKTGTSGDLAYTLATFSGGVTAPSGHTLAVSQRQADGSLKIIMQVSIPDPPAKK